jgi:hypothetical protein
LVVAGLVTSTLFAQDAPAKKGRGRGMVAWADANKDGKLDKACFVAAATKNVTDESKKDTAKTRAEGMFDRLAVAAGAADADKAKYVFTSEKDYTDALAKVRASFKGKKKQDNPPAK